jgi:cytochrome c-type biogenesis protein
MGLGSAGVAGHKGCMIATIALAFLAGVLSIMAPCVLPLLPLVLGAALAQHRLGPVALACGMALAFVAVGLFVATVGRSIGLDGEVMRMAAAAMLIAMGIVLMLPRAQARLALAAGPVSNWAEQRFGGVSSSGLGGQFAVGLLLGAVWSPCVGPTLGAASVLASQGRDLGQVAVTMLAFGIGAALPLVLLGFASREVLLRWRDRLAAAGKGGKAALGVLLAASGLLILTGWDKRLETALVDASPDWLVDLTTRF